MIARRSAPRFHTSRVTSAASRISTIWRSASTSRVVVPSIRNGSGREAPAAPLSALLRLRASAFVPPRRSPAGGDAGQVLPIARVDLEDVALIDEQRNL